MPRASATAHELARIELLGSLPGEQLAKLASRMRRETVLGGATPIVEGEEGDRFYAVLSGMFSVTKSGPGARTILRPGDYFTNALDARGCVMIATADTMLKDPLTGSDYPTSRPLFLRQNAGPALRGTRSCG